MPNHSGFCWYCGQKSESLNESNLCSNCQNRYASDHESNTSILDEDDYGFDSLFDDFEEIPYQEQSDIKEFYTDKYSSAKILLKNIAGIIVGLFVYYLADYLLRTFFGWLITIPFVASYLSWPVTPDWWAMVIICTATPFLSLYTASLICGPNKSGIKIGIPIMGFIIVIISIVYAVYYCNIEFSWMYIIQAGITIIVAICGICEEIKKN